jgi:hypothetical protein
MDMSYSTPCSRSIRLRARETATLTLQRSAPAARAAATARPGSSTEAVSPSIRITYSVATCASASNTISGHDTRPVSRAACTRHPCARNSATKRSIFGLSTFTAISACSRYLAR